jgi:hypothetical protein
LLARSACYASAFIISAPINGALASGAGRPAMAEDDWFSPIEIE